MCSLLTFLGGFSSSTPRGRGASAISVCFRKMQERRCTITFTTKTECKHSLEKTPQKLTGGLKVEDVCFTRPSARGHKVRRNKI
jgi:hypothetical protein